MSYLHDCRMTDARLMRKGDIFLAMEIMRNNYPWPRVPSWSARRGRYDRLVWC